MVKKTKKTKPKSEKAILRFVDALSSTKSMISLFENDGLSAKEFESLLTLCELRTPMHFKLVRVIASHPRCTEDTIKRILILLGNRLAATHVAYYYADYARCIAYLLKYSVVPLNESWHEYLKIATTLLANVGPAHLGTGSDRKLAEWRKIVNYSATMRKNYCRPSARLQKLEMVADYIKNNPTVALTSSRSEIRELGKNMKGT